MSGRKAKRIVIVGAGPGGLTAAMILGRRGYDVEVFEKQPQVGGRNARVSLGDFHFDLGPTFLMLKPVLDQVFQEAGADGEQILTYKRLEPMYRLQFADRRVEPTTDSDGMKREIGRVFPGKEATFDAFMEREGVRFAKLFPCLQRPYHQFRSLFSAPLLKSIPHLALGKSLYDLLSGYFGDPELSLSFTFQAKYLGMSPWECPGLFAIIAYIEHYFGIYHVQGGLSRISVKMAETAAAHGVKLHLGQPVRKLLLDGRQAVGVELQDGRKVAADEVVINADFAHAMSHLVPDGALRKYSPEQLRRKRFSCSTFMLYLGLDKVYDLPHHTIFFARDYRQNVADVFGGRMLSDDFSFYVHNPSVTDPTLAPPGQSAVYVLVPAPNLRADVDWTLETERFQETVLEAMEKRAGMADLRQHIKEKKVVSPLHWEDDYSVYAGATFNLAHNFGQMLYLRPRNKFEELGHCYLVGGGTHPGSGLPTIYQSGLIAANLISQSDQD
jgi:phytoene desaturase